MTFKQLTQGAACALLASALAACGGGTAGDPKYDSVGTSPTVPTKNPPTISTQPQSASVQTGAAATFTVTAAGTGLSYQWNRDSTATTGATSASYTVPNVGYLDNGAKFTVVVTNTDGSVTSSTALLKLALSTDQQAFETSNVLPGTGSVTLHWFLNLSGSQVSGTNYGYSETASTILSPLTLGPQTNTQGSPQNMTHTLALSVESAPTRVLKAGVILVVPSTQSSRRISYVGSSVQVDSLASDNSTVAYSETRSNFSSVALTGAMGNTPDELAHALNSFFANPAVLTPTATYTTGSSYLKYDAVNKGDRYTAFDCQTATTDANITPCASATTLQLALTAGLTSNSDGRTYHLADGAVVTAEGVSVWVATAARPVSATLSSTVEYRMYFQLNGNVYTGSLVKDGVKLGGSYWISNPAGATVQDQRTFLNYQIRLNQAARDSIAAGMTQ